MGSGSSTPSSRPPSRPSSSPPFTNGRRPRLLVNSGKHGSGSSRVGTPGLSTPNLDMVGVQKLRQRRREFDEEIGFNVRDADRETLQLLQYVQQAEREPATNAVGKLQLYRRCHELLPVIKQPTSDKMAVLVFQKEADAHVLLGDTEKAKQAYGRAIQIAETKVSLGEKDLYMMLKRYVMCMVSMARLWYEREKTTIGFQFANKKAPAVAATAPEEEATPSLDNSSVASTLLSDASFFSIGKEMIKATMPHQPRRRSGPQVVTVRLREPKKVKSTEYTAEDEFVLHSHMTRELKASPSELVLLRCCEVVELGHNRQSDLLIPALLELAQIYEDLDLFNRSLLLVRRCLGILCVTFDYDHPWVIELRRRADRLVLMLDDELRDTSATKIQATWRMHEAMRRYEEIVGHPVTRHIWIGDPLLVADGVSNPDFLQDYYHEIPDSSGTPNTRSMEASNPDSHGDQLSFNGHPSYPSDSLDEQPVKRSMPSSTRAVPPQPSRPQPKPIPTLETETFTDEEDYDPGDPQEEPQPHPPAPRLPIPQPPPVATGRELVRAPDTRRTVSVGTDAPEGTILAYDPVVYGSPASNFTQFINNAEVLGTVHNTQTNTQLTQTELGGVLTIRTVTITRTITKREHADDDEATSTEGTVDMNEYDQSASASHSGRHSGERVVQKETAYITPEEAERLVQAAKSGTLPRVTPSAAVPPTPNSNTLRLVPPSVTRTQAPSLTQRSQTSHGQNDAPRSNSFSTSATDLSGTYSQSLPSGVRHATAERRTHNGVPSPTHPSKAVNHSSHSTSNLGTASSGDINDPPSSSDARLPVIVGSRPVPAPPLRKDLRTFVAGELEGTDPDGI